MAIAIAPPRHRHRARPAGTTDFARVSISRKVASAGRQDVSYQRTKKPRRRRQRRTERARNVMRSAQAIHAASS